MTSSSVVLHNWRPSAPKAVCASILEHPSNTQNRTFFLCPSYHIHWSSPSSLSEAPGSVKCRISKWTNRCAHKGPGILASCFSGVAEAPWPLSGGGWLYDFRKVRLTSLGIRLRIYKMTSLKRISHICISSNVSHPSPPSLPWFLPFALFLMHIFSWGTNLTLHLMIYLQRWPIP